MKIKLINRVTPLQKDWDNPEINQAEMYHTCARYRDTLKGVFCKSCKQYDYDMKRKQAKLVAPDLSAQ